MFLREGEANRGHFSPRRQTNMRKLRLSCRKKEKFETLKGLEVSKLTYRLEISLFQRANENQLVIAKKNNEPNQKLTEIVVCE